eukprot:gene10992-7636_t
MRRVRIRVLRYNKESVRVREAGTISLYIYIYLYIYICCKKSIVLFGRGEHFLVNGLYNKAQSMR